MDYSPSRIRHEYSFPPWLAFGSLCVIDWPILSHRRGCWNRVSSLSVPRINYLTKGFRHEEDPRCRNQHIQVPEHGPADRHDFSPPFTGRRARLSSHRVAIERIHQADPLSVWTNVVPAAADYIFDPAPPAIVRSGLIDVMAEQNSMQRLDAEEEYLTGADHVESGFVTSFRVEAVLPGNLKDLKRYLRSDPSTHYEVKCRRIPTDADTVRRQLPTGTAPPRVIFVARISGRKTIVVAHRYALLGQC